AYQGQFELAQQLGALSSGEQGELFFWIVTIERGTCTILTSLSPGKAALSRKSREELRRIAGIPTVNDFPYQCCEGWKARAPMRPAQYSFNPIRHTVDKFVIDEAT
ncbi:hypothetical protein FOZ62_014291, partial [Perkinsus olseni]